MSKIKVWKSGRERIYIPIICPNCSAKVSVSGEIVEETLLCEPCPKCAQEIYLSVETPPDETEGPDELMHCWGEVTWHLDGAAYPVRTTTTGKCNDIIATILRVVDDGLQFYTGSIPYHTLLGLSLRRMIQSGVRNETLPELIGFIESVIDERKEAKKRKAEESKGKGVIMMDKKDWEGELPPDDTDKETEQ